MEKEINKKAVLFECGDSHVENLHLQIKALKENGYSIYLVCNERLKVQFSDLSVFSDTLFLTNPTKELTLKTKISDLLKFRRFLKKNKPNTLIVGTLENRLIKHLIMFPLPYIKNYIGIVHYRVYLEKSGTFKKLYSKFKKVILLNDRVLEAAKKTVSRATNLYCYNPIYFPSYSLEVEKKDSEFWIAIPGGNSFPCKDIDSLLWQLKEKKLNANIKLVLLSHLGPNTKRDIEEFGIKEHFITFEKFVSNDLFDAYMKASDIVMTLIHPPKISYYGDDRTSGSYNLAYGYKKPLLLEVDEQKSNKDFDDISIVYTIDKMVDKMNEVSQRPTEYMNALSAIMNHPYLNAEKQCERFIEIVEDKVK